MSWESSPVHASLLATCVVVERARVHCALVSDCEARSPPASAPLPWRSELQYGISTPKKKSQARFGCSKRAQARMTRCGFATPRISRSCFPLPDLTSQKSLTASNSFKSRACSRVWKVWCPGCAGGQLDAFRDVARAAQAYTPGSVDGAGIFSSPAGPDISRFESTIR